MTKRGVIWDSFIFILFALVLNGCALSLGPNYDKALVDGLTSTNTAVMEFFASLSGGSEKDTFPQRKEKYSSLIGHFDALAIQAKARPVPKYKLVEKINDNLSKRGVPVLNDSDIPSSIALTKISQTLAKMRNTDEKQGITAYEVQAFKNQISIYMDQALTYENFLKR